MRVLVFGEGTYGRLVWQAISEMDGVYVAPVLPKRLREGRIEHRALGYVRPDLIVLAGVEVDRQLLGGRPVVSVPCPQPLADQEGAARMAAQSVKAERDRWLRGRTRVRRKVARGEG